MKTLFTYVLPIGIILVGLILSITTDILKDTSQSEKKPYSFARTQLMWWSLIIIASYSCYYGLTDEAIKLEPSLLILLGISLSTSTVAKIIDVNEISNKVTRHQDQNSVGSFLKDILSDNDGISVHRFQSLLFNIIFGLIFITTFISTNKFYTFDQTQLTLLGISSAGYVGMKLNENK